MRTILPTLVVLVSTMVATGCKPILSDQYEKALTSGARTIPPVSEFLKLYPDSVIFISYFSSGNDGAQYNCETLLHERYILHMKDKGLSFDQTRTNIAGHGLVSFSLSEVSKIDRLNDGRFYIKYGESWKFGIEDWKRFNDAGGQFSTVSINLKTNAPVELLQDYWKGFKRTVQ